MSLNQFRLSNKVMLLIFVVSSAAANTDKESSEFMPSSDEDTLDMRESIDASSGMPPLYNMVMEEFKENTTVGLLNFTCNLFKDLEKLIDAHELKSVLNMINNKLQLSVCRDTEKFASYIPENFDGMNIEEIRAQKMQEIVRIFSDTTSEYDDDAETESDVSSGLLPIIIREALSNRKLHGFTCLRMEELLSLIKTKPLKDHLGRFYKTFVEPSCETPDVAAIIQELHKIYNVKDSGNLLGYDFKLYAVLSSVLVFL